MASISKLIGTTVLMKLQAAGKLDFDQRLAELLPEFPEKELAQTIKLRHLLTHTSGLPDYAAAIDSVFLATGVVPTKKDFLAFFRGRELFFAPGTHYQYCNSGFMLMAFIAENAAQANWQELIEEHLNAPTGLDFQLIADAAALPEQSPIFDLVEQQFERVPTWVYVIGDGGLTATASALAKFPTFWNGKLLSPDAFATMIAPQQLNDATPTGYGFGVRNGNFLGEPLLGHTGGWKSTYAVLAYFPERQLTFAGLMNTDGTPASMSRIFAECLGIVLNKTPKEYANKNIPLAEPSAFTGQYHGYDEEFDEIGSVVTIALTEAGTLNYCIAGHCEPLRYLGNNRFWLASYPYDFIEFHLDEAGIATALREYYHGFFQVFRKRLRPSN